MHRDRYVYINPSGIQFFNSFLLSVRSSIFSSFLSLFPPSLPHPPFPSFFAFFVVKKTMERRNHSARSKDRNTRSYLDFLYLFFFPSLITNQSRIGVKASMCTRVKCVNSVGFLCLICDRKECKFQNTKCIV